MTNSGVSAKTVLFYAFVMAAAGFCLFSAGYGYGKFMKNYDCAQNAGITPPRPPAQPRQFYKLDDIAPRAVRFVCNAPDAGEVFLHADFNLWGAHEIKLEKGEGGRFSKTIALPQGEYKYYYSVDGKYTPDADAPQTVFFNGQEAAVKTVL
jgi:hypothetical protein